LMGERKKRWNIFCKWSERSLNHLHTD